MLYPIKVVDIELSQQIPTFESLEAYMGLQGLVRLHGVPLGYVKAPISLGKCTALTLSKLILEEYSEKIIHQLLKNGMASPHRPADFRLEDLLHLPLVEYVGECPLVTVAVCTRDRPTDMVPCLDALCQLDYPHLDLLVIDNAPSNHATEQVVQQYANVRYVCEPRPGLDWARNRAILESKGEIVAYTDDDVVVDVGWVRALAKMFAENPEVMAVTGLVVPYELDTEAQVLFEMYGGFGRGFQQKWSRIEKGNKMPWGLLGTGQFGAGANMAYRRAVFAEIGYFDPAMDVGTVTNGGGDLEMYFRILKEGHTLVYEPSAIVRHRHRRDYEKLRTQISNNGIGLYSYFTCGISRYPEERFNFLYLGVYWLLSWHARRLLISFLHPFRFPRDLILAELQGFFQNFGRYQQSRRRAAEITYSFRDQPFPPALQSAELSPEVYALRQSGIAMRTVELSLPLEPLTDIIGHSELQVLVTLRQQPLGSIQIQNTYQPLSQSRLIGAIVNKLGLEILQAEYPLNKDLYWSNAVAALTQRLLTSGNQESLPERFPQQASISIVISTYDRPTALQRCLTQVLSQTTDRSVQILVVDNNPSSGLTPPIVEQFPGVLLQEPRRGSSYARNRGILESTGEIIVMLDNDVVVLDTWLENLLAPFLRHDVMAVTGNILPMELDTAAQKWLEICGGMSRGFEQFNVNGDWFEACLYRTAPTWAFGSCANAAFRAHIFKQPQVGLLDESLGIGTPAGGGDDLYLFYKLVKAGYTLVYQPTACVRHQHYREMSAFRRQIFNAGKGHVAYQLNTLLKDGDLRVLARLLVGLPLLHLQRIYYHLRGWSYRPIWLTLLELAGNLVGPLGLLQSRLRLLWLKRRRFSAGVSINVPQLIADDLTSNAPAEALIQSKGSGVS